MNFQGWRATGVRTCRHCLSTLPESVRALFNIAHDDSNVDRTAAQYPVSRISQEDGISPDRNF